MDKELVKKYKLKKIEKLKKDLGLSGKKVRSHNNWIEIKKGIWAKGSEDEPKEVVDVNQLYKQIEVEIIDKLKDIGVWNGN